MFNLNSRTLKKYNLGTEPMARKSALSLREKAAREVLASIGRGLKDQYDAPQSLSEHLAELVRQIEQATNE